MLYVLNGFGGGASQMGILGDSMAAKPRSAVHRSLRPSAWPHWSVGFLHPKPPKCADVVRWTRTICDSEDLWSYPRNAALKPWRFMTIVFGPMQFEEASASNRLKMSSNIKKGWNSTAVVWEDTFSEFGMNTENYNSIENVSGVDYTQGASKTSKMKQCSVWRKAMVHCGTLGEILDILFASICGHALAQIMIHELLIAMLLP